VKTIVGLLGWLLVAYLQQKATTACKQAVEGLFEKQGGQAPYVLRC
jgi:hypothetical protein